MGKGTTFEVNAKLWGEAARDWADIQERQVEAVYDQAFARLGVEPGVRYLDAGCGAGMALALAQKKGAMVSGIDASSELLSIARARVPEADLHRADLQSLPFKPGVFDVTTGFNAFQYAADPVAALKEAARVTRRGGQVLIMTWGAPRDMPAAALVGALGPLLPPPPPGAPGPFALSEDGALSTFARKAGLAPVAAFDTSSPFRYASLDEALRGLGSSGVAARAIAVAGREAVDNAHAAALTPHSQDDGSYLIGASFRCLIARA